MYSRAKIIEKHVTLDKKDPGPDQSVSIDFNDLHHLVDGIKKIELSMNSIKRINSKEVPIELGPTDLYSVKLISQRTIYYGRNADNNEARNRHSIKGMA